jgi:eukaryotic-like serine/threonine-protein kinase
VGVSQQGAGQMAGVFEGQVLAGKYRVERVLGRGGMGVVVAAHHIGLDEKVAIKFLLPEMLENPEAVSRFAREAKNAIKIKGEHMTRVLDVGTLDNGAPYMVMEYLEGGDLAGWLQQRGPLPFEEAVDFVLQAGEAIAVAHSLGIVHRDLKPANLFCVRGADGRLCIKVLDFGISKVTRLGGSPSEMAMTSTAALMGSPFYMSPEQLEASHAVDHRTDLWALGVILHELVTGKVPFPGETVPEVSIKVHSRPPPLLREIRPDAPDGLQAVILRCLEKDRERRYGNVGELALALLPLGSKRAKASVERITDVLQTAGLSASALSLPPSSEPSSQPFSAESIAPLGGTSSGKKGGKKGAVGLVAVIGTIALAGMMVFAVVTKKRQEPPPAASTSVATVDPTPVALPPVTGSTQPPVATLAPPPPTTFAEPPPGPSHSSARLPWSKPPVAAHPKPEATAAPTGSPPTTTTSHPSPAPPTPPTAKPDCDPNYTIDPKSGAHLFKPECFSKK